MTKLTKDRTRAAIVVGAAAAVAGGVVLYSSRPPAYPPVVRISPATLAASFEPPRASLVGPYAGLGEAYVVPASAPANWATVTYHRADREGIHVLDLRGGEPRVTASRPIGTPAEVTGLETEPDR